MLAKLEFTLPEEREEYRICMQAGEMHSALWDFQEYLRKYDKHVDLEAPVQALLDEIRNKFYECIEDVKLS